MWEYNYYPNSDELYHHGIMGMHWGKRNGPPYPLGASDHSASEKKAGWRKSLDSDGRVAAAKKNKKIAKKNLKVAKTNRKIADRNTQERYYKKMEEIEKGYKLGQNLSEADQKREEKADKQAQDAWKRSKKSVKNAKKAYKDSKKEYRDVKKEARQDPEVIKRRQETAKKVAKAALIGAVGAAVVGGAVVAAKSDIGRKYYNKRRERDAKKVAEGIANHLNSLGISDKHFYASPGPNISSNNKHKPKNISDELKRADSYWKSKGKTTTSYWQSSTGRNVSNALSEKSKTRYRGNDLNNSYQSINDLSMDELYKLLK